MKNKGVWEVVLTFVSIFSVFGFISSSAMLMSLPPQANAFFFYNVLYGHWLQRVSQLTFAILFIVSVYLLFKIKRNPKP